MRSLLFMVFLTVTAQAYAQKCSFSDSSPNGYSYSVDISSMEAVVLYGPKKGGATGSGIHFKSRANKDPNLSYQMSLYVSDDAQYRLEVQQYKHSEPVVKMIDLTTSTDVFKVTCSDIRDPKPLNSLLEEDNVIGEFSGRLSFARNLLCLLDEDMTKLDKGTKAFTAQMTCKTREGDHYFGQIYVEGDVITLPGYKTDQNLLIKKLELSVGE